MKTKFNENGIMVLDFEGKNITLGEAYYKYLSTASEPNNYVYANGVDDEGKTYGVWYYADPDEINELDEIDYSEPYMITDESGKIIY